MAVSEFSVRPSHDLPTSPSPPFIQSTFGGSGKGGFDSRPRGPSLKRTTQCGQDRRRIKMEFARRETRWRRSGRRMRSAIGNIKRKICKSTPIIGSRNSGFFKKKF